MPYGTTIMHQLSIALNVKADIYFFRIFKLKSTMKVNQMNRTQETNPLLISSRFVPKSGKYSTVVVICVCRKSDAALRISR